MAATPGRFVRRYVLVALLLPSPLLLTSSPLAAGGPACLALQQWAEQYRDVSMSLDQLARFDRAHRIAIFNVASPEARAAWWQAQIQRLGERPDLTAAQRALTVEGAALLTPALYRREPVAAAAFKAFWTRADPAFASFELRRAWMDLGATAIAVNAAASDDFYCECRVGLGVGQCGGTLCGNGHGCSISVGCGVSGLDLCDGMCQ